MNKLMLLIVMMSLLACKGDKNASADGTTPAANAAPVVEKPKFDERLPDACSLLSEDLVVDIIGGQKGAVEIKDGSHSQNLFSRACFFKWEDPGVKNAGIMVQVMLNPVEHDEPEYLSIYIASKKTSGETSMGGEKVLYKDFPGFGDDGAYSYTFHKYMWRQGNDFSYMIAFNTVMTEAEELAAAKRIATAIMKKVQ